MAQKKSKSTKSKPKLISDDVYLLKIVLYLILGSLWLRIILPDGQIPLPIGAAIGVVFASHDHFKIDRKIEYAVLLVSMFISFWLPIGIEIIL